MITQSHDSALARPKMPVQAPPVDRTPSAAARNGTGVEPSDWFTDQLLPTLGQAAISAAPSILGALGGLI